MKREVLVISYFSIPTNLAAEMSGWPEYVRGEGYSVDLKSPGKNSAVSVRFIENEEHDYVAVSAQEVSPLFEKTLGHVIYSLSRHSDDLMVSSHP